MKKINEKQIITKLEKLDEISRRRWLSGFPTRFPDKVWNGHYEREETLLKKDLNKEAEKNPRGFYDCVEKSNVKKYWMSPNNHTGKVGLDDQITPQGGGIIAQADSEEECLKIAFEVYGINNYFIS